MNSRRYLFPTLILVVGLIASLLAAWQLGRAEARRSLARFENASSGAATEVANKMGLQLALLRGTGGLFSASEEVAGQDFRSYVDALNFERNYPGILGIGFAEAGVRGTPIGPKPLVDAGLVSSIRYLEPSDYRNRVALGVDMLTEATRREAMLRAWNTDRPALSGVVQLVQEVEREKQPGILMYLPVRNADGQFRGWAYSPLRGYDLFGSVFGKPEFAGLRIAVFEGAATPANQLFSNGEAPRSPRHRRSFGVPVGGRQLTVEVSSTPAFERAAPLTLPLVVGILGLAITGLLAALAFQRERAVERIRDRVDHATAELRAANRKLREESEARGEAEAQLFQAQKMEAVGQLTGGIAHDFNNMLAVVIGSLDFARQVDDVDRLKRLMDQALKGATKAAELTQRLLAFSRRQTLVPSVLDPNRLVSEMSELLRRTLGAQVRLETVLAGGVWKVHADAAQLESAILNLAVNARDAMPDGGQLTIETANCFLDETYVETNPEAEAGQYAMIAVTDTGSGIPAAVRERVLEPFFTTKAVGKGTGLGLSQVFGFVKQSGGHLKIYSEEGHGTTIRIYLPRYRVEESVGASGEDLPPAEELPRGRPEEIILAVEDEEDVRLMSVGALRELGYTVIHASDGKAALRCLEGHPGVRLVFTDVIMPEMDGAQLATEIRRTYPDLRLLFTTGYARNAIAREGRLEEDVALISKPFTISQLARKVRQVLDEPAEADA